jgi:hypothetical protein
VKTLTFAFNTSKLKYIINRPCPFPFFPAEVRQPDLPATNPPPRNQRRSTHRPRIRTHDRLIDLSHEGRTGPPSPAHGIRNPHASRARADHGDIGTEDRSPLTTATRERQAGSEEYRSQQKPPRAPPRTGLPLGASNAGVVAGELELARASDLHIHDAPPTLALRLLIPLRAAFLDLSHHLLVRLGSPTTLAPSPVAPGRLRSPPRAFGAPARVGANCKHQWCCVRRLSTTAPHADWSTI